MHHPPLLASNLDFGVKKYRKYSLTLHATNWPTRQLRASTLNFAYLKMRTILDISNYLGNISDTMMWQITYMYLGRNIDL